MLFFFEGRGGGSEEVRKVREEEILEIVVDGVWIGEGKGKFIYVEGGRQVYRSRGGGYKKRAEKRMNTQWICKS